MSIVLANPKRSQNIQLFDHLMRHFIQLIAPSCILVVCLIVFFISQEALPFFFQHSLSDVVNMRWVPVSFQQQSFGILGLLSGSLLVSTVAILFCVPVGMVMAIYIAEMASSRESTFLKAFVELLASVPSVVLGFFGLLVLSPLIKDILQLDSALNALSAGLLLGFMALPTIVSLSEDALHNVPKNYKEAALALGATPVEASWSVVLPAALPGITAAVLLGVGRVMGETMVALMLTGNSPAFSLNPLDAVRTLTATIAAEMGEVSYGSPHYQALFFVGFILLLLTLAINFTVQRLTQKQA